MAIEIKEFDFKDMSKAARMAAEGMHYHEYVSGQLAFTLYGLEAIYGEAVRSTHFYGAYEGENLLGFMFVALDGAEKPLENSRFAKRLKVFEAVARLFPDFQGEANYLKACEQLKAGLSEPAPLEITYFAVDPDANGKGIGTLLMNYVHSVYQGKRAFLYTDDQCNFGYYDHKGFTCEGHVPVQITKKLTLDCMIYTKQF